jgi:DNA-binding transcriptional MerR regulator
MIAHVSRLAPSGEGSDQPLPVGKDDTCEFMTIDRLAAAVDLTPRTIRSYHARGLLPPPTRIGRTPYYGGLHLARMRSVLRLQSRGLPLEAIRALLEPDMVLGETLLPRALVAGALRADPQLIKLLDATGVITVRPDGGLSIRSTRAVLAARAASRPGTPIGQALRMLADVIKVVLPLASATQSRMQAVLPARTDTCNPDDLLELAVEVFRVCLAAPVRRRTQASAAGDDGRGI